MIRCRARIGASLLGASLLVLLTAASASAHAVEHAGPYTLEIGWLHEPTYVGDANAVQVTITDAKDKPVLDLKSDDLSVVVSTGGQQTGELTFEPGFDVEELEGPLGEYDAATLPTAPGDYTFHLTGTIHGQAVDITVSSGDRTFDTVKGTADLQFPTKLPTLSEVVTRLDRIDGRIADLQASSGPSRAGVDAARAAATEARQAADRALLIGAGLGLAGLVIGVMALAVALRTPRQRQT